jgi:hypothetical protein
VTTVSDPQKPEQVFAPSQDEGPKLGKEPPKPVEGRYTGSTALAPFPMSRLAPQFALVDLAKEIEKADAQMATMTGGKLLLIADQIRHLQETARGLLEKAQKDAELHRARCSFEKKPGSVYHLYREEDGVLWFSLIAPEEWRTCKPEFVATYRLESDMSFTEQSKIAEADQAHASIRGLLAR